MPKKKSTKSKKEKIKVAQICPHCGSPDIETDFSNAAAVMGGYLNVKKCNNCKHKGTFFPSVPISEIKKPLKSSQVKTKTITDTTFARGYFGIYMLYFAILFILIGAYLLIIKSPSGIILVLAGIIALIVIKIRNNLIKNKLP